jgi:DNA-binding protein YbaB
MFDKLKGLMELQKKMQQIKAELDRTTFDVSSGDGSVTITMNGAQQVENVRFADGLDAAGGGKQAAALKEAFNRAIKRSQEIAASKMKEATGMNLPGM